MKSILLIGILFLGSISCSKNNSGSTTVTPENFYLADAHIDNDNQGFSYNFTNVKMNPTFLLTFSVPVNEQSVNTAILMKDTSANNVSLNYSYSRSDSVVIVKPNNSLTTLTSYSIQITTGLLSHNQTKFNTATKLSVITTIDSTDKFPQISDSALLDLVQKQTFKYFWDFGHPVSGMARERSNGDNQTIAVGGTGFGIMATVVAVNRNFILRSDGLNRLLQIVNFLSASTTSKYHGAFPHWLNGTTGAIIPFSNNDDGADLVETSYLIEGLLIARQYFNSSIDANEIDLRTKINTLYNNVEWSWFRQSNNQNVLYWHWSPDKGWIMNFPIKGWDEALITYVMAASSTTHSIPKVVYDSGWAQNGNIKNGNVYYGIKLPLGPSNGGPLFFAHYSFLGINPTKLSDAYADYWTQDTSHAKINYTYCVSNPKNNNGYSDACWGLTSSDDNSGYLAHEPNNDDGVITPSAALSSFPYTPNESMKALHFFYYKLGDKIWSTYGFIDAFNLTNTWYAGSFLAIDQGPIIGMIENYRSGLLWNLFMSCPEIKTGMRGLGFQSPNL